MEKKRFCIPTRITFNGQVVVLAENQDEAEDVIRNMVTATLGSVADSVCEYVIDWEFPITGDVEVK